MIKANATHYLKSILLMSLGLFGPVVLSAQTTYKTSTKCQSSYGNNLSFSFSSLPNNCGSGTFSIYYRGDHSANTEYWSIYDEVGVYFGRTVATRDCATGFDKLNLNISDTTLARWTRDGKTSFNLRPTTAMNFCGAANNCVYLELTYDGKTQGNNTSVLSIDSPTVFCAGSRDVYATIANVGDSLIDSVRVFWSVNGVKQTTIKSTTKIDTCGGSGARAIQIKLGTVNFNTAKDVKVWTGFPNGVRDIDRTDDTISAKLSPALNGTYSIAASGGDYSSPAAAIADLNQYGVCGPVLFNVANGTYNGQLIIDEISGASATNTITFRGQDSSLTIISHSGRGSNYSTIHLRGADYFTFERLKIETTASTDGWCVLFSNDSRYNEVHNCRIEMRAASVTDLIGFVASNSTTSEFTEGLNANYIVINNNVIVGGEKALHFEARGSQLGKGISITNNLMTGNDDYGIYMDDQDSLVITGNKIENMRSGAADGIYVFDLENFDISNNNVHAPDWAMYINDGNFNGNGRAKINNNLVRSNSDYGLYLNDARDVDVLHNTFSGRLGILFDDYNGIDARNNIFIGNGNYAFSCDQNSGFNSLDYNVYYRSSGTPYRYNRINYNTLADWQAAVPAFNANSYFENPPFVSTTNLRLNASVEFRRAPYVGIDVDVDGDARCKIVASIGADESAFPEPLATASFSRPDTIWISSPVVLQSNYAGNSASHEWYVNDTLLSTDAEYELTRGTASSIRIKYIIRTCSGSDSLVDTIPVVIPTRVPKADFIADKNLVLLNESITLTDISENGPVSWSYSVTPDSIYDPVTQAIESTYDISGSGRVQTLDIYYPGTYSVKLVVANFAGTDSVVKTNYITVRQTATMCLADNTTDILSGILYDEGGPNGNYSNGRNGASICEYLINPCAEDMYITFDEFNLSSGDYLRIYEGDDNTGTPMYNTNDFPNGLTGNTSGANFPDSLFASAAPIFIEFESNNSGTNTGFEMNWNGKVANVAPPVVSMSIPDTICIDKDYVFEGLATGKNVSFEWKIGFSTSLSQNADVNISTPGTYTVELTGTNCGGSDVATRTFYADSSRALPSFGLSKSITNAMVGDVVTLATVASDCNYGHVWKFDPADKVQFTVGSSSTDDVVDVLVLDTGCVDVIVSVTNGVGVKVDTFFCYINAKELCIPSVISTSTDVGISRVQLNTIDNRSTIGDARYTNYSGDPGTDLSKGASYDLKLSRNTTLNKITRAAWIDYNQDGDFEDAGELLGWENKASTQHWTLNFTIPKAALTGATRMRVAAIGSNARNLPCGQAKVGEYEDYRVYIQPDLIAPVITLTGGDTVRLERGYTWVEPGYSAIDNVDGNLTANVKLTGSVNNKVAGAYSIIYSVSDSSSNSSSRTRVVIVTPDVTVPTASLNGKEVDTIEVYSSYTDPGLTALDLADSLNLNIVIDRSKFDTLSLGEKQIVYTISDQSGNFVQLTRTIWVIDSQLPVLALNGNATDTIDVFSTYNDPGVTASDNFWTSLSVNSGSNVNTRELGTYTITYSVTDGSGNGPVTVSRTVIVVDREAPKATLIGSDVVKHQVNTQLSDLGVTASDNYDRQVSIAKSGTFYTTFADGFASDTGTYDIVYTISDASGNDSVLVRTVNVVDEIAPVISLSGAPIVQIKRWDDYTDAGYTLDDNYYDSVSITIVELTDFTSQSEGVYYYQYKATDPSGNVAFSGTRTIFVGPNSIDEPTGGVSVELYPNPVNTITTLNLELDRQQQVGVQLFNLQGQLVQSVYSGQANDMTITIDVGELASGTYLVSITGETFVEQKLIEVKR